jgi:hypothetical protein
MLKYQKIKDEEDDIQDRILELQAVTKDIKENTNLNLENVSFVIFITNENKPMLTIKILDRFETSRSYLKSTLINLLCKKYNLYYSETDKKSSDFYIFFEYI